MPVFFYTQQIHYLLRNKRQIRSVVTRICEENGYQLGAVNYILCSKAVIKSINIRYLGHHYYTDIITFPLSEDPQIVSADIYICVPVVRENALRYRTSNYTELLRVLFHGILHMVGYDDHIASDQQKMRSAEDYWLAQFALLV